MPFNPRRDKSPQPPPAVNLSTEQIRSALERAVDLRRQNAIRPEDVQGHALCPGDAIQSTEGYRRNRRWHTAGDTQPAERDAWWRVGWITQEPAASIQTPPSQTVFRATWEVWLNVDDGRVWMKTKRSR